MGKKKNKSNNLKIALLLLMEALLFAILYGTTTQNFDSNIEIANSSIYISYYMFFFILGSAVIIITIKYLKKRW